MAEAISDSATRDPSAPLSREQRLAMAHSVRQYRAAEREITRYSQSAWLSPEQRQALAAILLSP